MTRIHARSIFPLTMTRCRYCRFPKTTSAFKIRGPKRTSQSVFCSECRSQYSLQEMHKATEHQNEKRRCSECGRIKPYIEFKGNYLYISSRCADCRSTVIVNERLRFQVLNRDGFTWPCRLWGSFRRIREKAERTHSKQAANLEAYDTGEHKAKRVER